MSKSPHSHGEKHVFFALGFIFNQIQIFSTKSKYCFAKMSKSLHSHGEKHVCFFLPWASFSISFFSFQYYEVSLRDGNKSIQSVHTTDKTWKVKYSEWLSVVTNPNLNFVVRCKAKSCFGVVSTVSGKFLVAFVDLIDRADGRSVWENLD